MGNTQSNSTPDPIENTDAQPKESDQADGVAVEPGLTDPETQPEGVNDQTDEQTETETDVDQETAGQEETPESDLGEEQNVEEDSVEEDSFDQGEIAGLDPDSRVEGNMTGEQLTLPSTNFIAAYFTQRSPDEESGSVNPLVYVKDFMSWVYEGNALNLDKLESFVADTALNANAKLTPAQIDLFTLFRAKHEEWKETIETNINDSATTLREKTSKTPERDFKYEDYTQHFKGAVPENLITAISTGAFLWLSENAGGTGINTVSVIKQMLGLKEDDTVDPQDIIRFTHVGTRRDFVIQDLGEKVRQALEMTTHKNVPIDELAKFELAMGAHAFALLQQMGLTQQTAEIALTSESLAFLEQAEQTDENNDFNPPSLYVKATRNGTIPIQANEEIVVASRLGDRFLNQLMSVEEKIVPPALKPGMFNQLKTKIKQLVPKTQQKIAKLVSKRPHSIRQDMKRVRDSLSDIGQLQVTGWVDLDSGQNWHDGIKIPQESRNEELERGNTALKEFDEQVGLEYFFTVPVIWKHQRTGQSSNTINTQTNKQHRHNVTMNAWGVEVDPTVDNALLRNFKLAIAQGMGLKVDKQNPERSIAQLNALMASEEVQDALEAIDSIEPGIKLSEKQENAIIAVTQGIKVNYNNNNLKVGGENTHTLDALVNWNAYVNATEAGTSFTTEMLFEVDGVTNGPALSLIMMGAVNSLLGEKFGMFGTSSPHTSHAEYISDTNNDDLYETIVKNAKLLINQNKTAIKLQDDMGSLFKLDRNEIKTPVQMMFFGANLEKAIQSLASGIEERFYQEIQDISNDTSTTEQEALKATRNVIDRLNVLLDDQNALPYFKTGQEALSTVLKPDQVKMIGESFYNKSGKHIKTALERQFASFQASRSEMNKSATATWLRYDAAYQFLYSAEVARKIKKGTMPTDSAGNPLQELTDTDIAAIDTLLKEHNFVPVMHTPLSKGDMNLDAGIRADQSEYVTDEDSQTYFQSVRFGMPVPTVRTKTNRKGTLSQLSVTGRRRGSVDPGVAPFLLMIHALDSAISTLAIRVMKALNIHDAHGLGVSNIKQGANELNKHTFNLLANFSVPMEMADSLQRSMDGELGLLESLSEDQQAYGDLAAVLSDVALESEFEPDIFVDMRYMENVRRFALRAESSKLGYLSQIGLVDQYSFPGGAYEVSAQQRELAARNKAVIDAQLKELNNKPKQGTTTEEKVEVPPVVPTPLPEETPWGVVGNGTNNSDPELVAMLSGDNVTIGSLLKPLANLIKSYENSPYNKFQIELLRRIYETTPSDTKIILVNANTPVPASIAKAIKEGKSRGLFSVKNGVRTIYIRGPQFEGPGVTSEVVLHELSHASTAEVVKAAREDETSMPLHVVEAVADLEQLRERAQQYMVDNKIESEAHTLALSSVDELVGFGMTNPQFQQEILAKVTFPIEEQNRSGEPAKNGLKRFFDAISTIIFGSAKEDQSNGLGVLVYNVGVLTQQTAEIKTAEQGDINLSIEETTPRTFDTRQVYEALASRDSTEAISPIHDMRLRSILAAVVSAAYGNTGALKPAAERAAPVTAEDVFLNSLTSGIRPFASALSAELLMTDQEAFVAESAELTLRAALSMREAVTNRNELTKLRNLAKKQITAEKLYDGDWANASNDQKRQAERVHSIIFDATQYDGNKSDYLSQFAAAALTYQPLVEQLALISIPENSETYAGLTVKEALELFFKKLMDMYVRFATGIEQNQNVPTRIMQLATNLATIENKEKSKIESRKDRPEPLLDQASKKLSDGIKQGVIAVADSGLVQGSKVKVVSALGSLVSTVAGERTEEVMRHFNKILDRDSGVRLSAQRELINEITNGRPDLQISNSLLNMSNKHEQDRKRLKEYTASATLTAFLGELNKKQSEALTKTFIKTDVSSLVDDFTLAEIEQLISDPVELNRAIAALEAQLAKENSTETYNYYSTSAEGLGIMMATGINLMEANLMHNAHNIAFLYATEQIITDQADVAANAALKIIDPLATLYALKHTSREQKNEASDLMRNEAARGNGQNGIDFLIKLHAELKEQSKAKTV